VHIRYNLIFFDRKAALSGGTCSGSSNEQTRQHHDAAAACLTAAEPLAAMETERWRPRLGERKPVARAT